jgi:hypothetical protein
MIVFGKNWFLNARCLTIGAALASGVFCAPKGLAQAAAETAATTSVTSGVAANAKPLQPISIIPAAATQGSAAASQASAPASQASPHIMSPTNSVSVDTNRRVLESRAGTDAARLLVRATPSQGQVWINNEPVGKTPLLLILAPGKYTLELRGSRQEIARQNVALLPKETREVSVKLQVRYPTYVVAAH